MVETALTTAVVGAVVAMVAIGFVSWKLREMVNLSRRMADAVSENQKAVIKLQRKEAERADGETIVARMLERYGKASLKSARGLVDEIIAEGPIEGGMGK